MYRELAHLLLYSDLGEGAILTRLAGIFRDWEHGADRDELVGRIYAQIKRLLDLSTDCGFRRELVAVLSDLGIDEQPKLLYQDL